MGKPITRAKTGTGQSDPVRLDTFRNPFTVGFQLVVSGTATGTVQLTLDDTSSTGWDPTAANWFSHATLAAATASALGSQTTPVTAWRINVTAGTGTVTVTSLQAG
jgi:hypothetical protein